MEVHEDNKTCDCVISQSKPGHFVEACKCEFDANLAEKKKCCQPKKSCCGEQSQQMKAAQQNCGPQQAKMQQQPNYCGPPQQQQQAQPMVRKCGEPIQQAVICGEDPFTALKNCVQKCMDEKAQLVQACGMKCPDCPGADSARGGKEREDMKAAPDQDAAKGANKKKGAKGRNKGAKGGAKKGKGKPKK